MQKFKRKALRAESKPAGCMHCSSLDFYFRRGSIIAFHCGSCGTKKGEFKRVSG